MSSISIYCLIFFCNLQGRCKNELVINMSNNVNMNMSGPIAMPVETSSGLDYLPTNRTLMTLPLSENGPKKPVEIPDDYMGSTEKVMEFVKPSVKVSLATGNPDNPTLTQTIEFQEGVQSFAPKSIAQRTPLLRSLQSEWAVSDSLIGWLDKSAQFRKAMDNPQARAAVLAILQDVINELNENIND
jgi:predicted component of type VI protein secretion system